MTKFEEPLEVHGLLSDAARLLCAADRFIERSQDFSKRSIDGDTAESLTGIIEAASDKVAAAIKILEVPPTSPETPASSSA